MTTSTLTATGGDTNTCSTCAFWTEYELDVTYAFLGYGAKSPINIWGQCRCPLFKAHYQELEVKNKTVAVASFNGTIYSTKNDHTCKYRKTKTHNNLGTD